jgi:hypothetical protein
LSQRVFAAELVRKAKSSALRGVVNGYLPTEIFVAISRADNRYEPIAARRLYDPTDQLIRRVMNKAENGNGGPMPAIRMLLNGNGIITVRCTESFSGLDLQNRAQWVMTAAYPMSNDWLLAIAAIGPKTFNVSSFVFQPPLRQHPQMRVFQRWCGDFPFREQKVHGSQMSAGKMISQISGRKSKRTIEQLHLTLNAGQLRGPDFIRLSGFQGTRINSTTNRA